MQINRALFKTEINFSGSKKITAKKAQQAESQDIKVPKSEHCLQFAYKYKNPAVQKLENNNTPIAILDELQNMSNEEKQDFIKGYCKITGFPDLEKANGKIRTESCLSLERASKKSGTPILWSGYHKNCSLAKGLAFPGSDLDGWSVIVDGSQEDINRFKGKLWENTNPLFGSIRSEFPYVFSIDQLYDWTKLIDKIAFENGLNSKEKEYGENLFELDDFEKALEFNIDIRNAIEKYPLDKLSEAAPCLKDEINQRKNNGEPIDMIPIWITSSMSTCLEPLRSGETLFDNLDKADSEKLNSIKNSFLFKYGNMSMQELRPGLKPKLKERQRINEDWFNKLSLDEKMSFISKMIYQSYSSTDKAQYKDKFDSIHKNMYDNGCEINNKRSKAIQKACG